MHSSIGREISILSRQFNIYIARELKPLNILPSEYLFIVNIERGKKTNQQNLCDEFIVDKAVATRAILSLVKKGIVIREKNPEDKREYLISLTPKGEDLKPLICEKLKNWTYILRGNMKDERINNIIIALKQFTKNALEENSNV